MADPSAPASSNVFDQFDPDKSDSLPPPAASASPAAPAATDTAPVAQDNKPNPFDQFGDVGPSGSSATGAFARGVEKGALPAAGGLAATGAGAEIGAAAGVPLAPFTGGWSIPVLSVAGGIGAGIFGVPAVQAAQNWAVHKLPESWQDAIGFGDRQARLDEAQHSGASFMGGLVPYAVTMSPKLSDLPKNATALQRILAHPVTGRMFGGALMGGMEAGNEEVSKEDLDWRKVAIATVFGTVFNRPNQIGEKVTELGGSPVRTVLGRLHPTPAPTLAQAADSKTFGPGITESVFQGTQEQAPEAAMTAQENARVEHAAIGEPPEPDLHGIARQMEPELFAKYEKLLQDRDLFSAHEPVMETHLAATEAEIRELSPDIAAAYRRAEDTVGTGTVEPERFPSFAAMLAARENETGRPTNAAQTPEAPQAEPAGEPSVQPSGEAPSNVEGPAGAPVAGAPVPQRTIGEQRASIAADVSQKLIAAGRPPEEAAAAAQLIAARYVTRAGRFGGKLGTPEELYAREGAAIAGPNGRPQAPAAAGPEPIKPSPTQGAAEDIVTKDIRKSGPRGRAAADPRTWSLSEYLASKGGLKPDPELHAIYGSKKGPMVGGFGPLLQHAGMTLDDALRAAKDGHYMLDAGDITGAEGKLTPRDLLDLLDNENRGNKTYRNDYVPPDKGIDPEEERGSIVSALHHEIQLSTGEQPRIDPALADRVVEIIQKEGGHDVLAAYERAIMEDHDRHEGLRDDRQANGSIPGWDAPDTGTSSSDGREHLGERGQAGVSSEEAREGHGAEPSDIGEGHREASSAIAAWDNLLSQRQDRISRFSANGGFNGKNDRYGRALRGKTTQVWEPGNTVNVGFLKDLLVTKDNGDGSFALLSKPDESGMSRAYEMKPHEGISGNAKKVDFLEHAKDVIASHEMAQNADEYFQAANGKILLRPGKRPIITLMKTQNASTFVHESGHQFLEELMRDANHPDAPPGLRDDAQTVRDWLGVTDDIKTKDHEKFARGFEQYLREGVAPSPELAGVFAKFRNWLLSIYQSIKGLGTEITPDIRNVFDRMLEQEPNRTVIAPERPAGGPLLHEVHAGDALHAEPHEADALADRAAAERERYIQEPRPEIAHEIAASVQKDEAEQAARAGTEPGGKDGGGAVGSSEVEPNSGGPGPQPDGGGVGAGGGEVGGGGSKPSAESAAAAKPNSRSKLGEHAGTALAPGPADLFGSRESPFTDKAGNIRVENLTTREDVAQAIRDSAAENNDFVGDRRGVITDGQVLELADALGMDSQTLNQRQLGQAFNAEQIVAARKLLIQSATDVSAAMKKAAIGTDEDVMAYAEAKDRHQLIQAQIAGITAEAGRALRAFRNIAGEESAQATDQFIKQATGKTLFQLRAEAKLGAELQTPQQVSKFMHDSGKTGFGRIVLEYWINGLISGPATHATYMVGNTISAIMKLPEAVASAAVGRAASALGRAGTGTAAGEAGALARGAVRGFAPAVKAGIDALRTGVTTALPGEGPAQSALPFQPGSELAQPAHLDEAATFHDAMSAAFGLVRGMRDTVMSTAAMVTAGGVPGESLVSRQYSMNRATPNIAFRGVTVLPTGDIATLPSRGVAVIHSFFRSLVFSMEKNAMAYRQAVNEGHAGTALEARVAQLRSDPSQATMNEAAAHEATESALMGKGSELTQRLAALTNTPIFGAPLLKFIDPFVRVSGNIIDQSLIRRTPVGLLTMLGPETELARDLTGKNGNVAQDKAIGRMMVGTTLAVTFGSLAAQKVLSGSGPKDPKEARVWMMAGNQPHSIRIGDTWYQVNKLGPMGMLASISADLYDVAHEAEQGDFTKAGAHLLHAITQNVLDESAMHGPAEMLKAIETPDRYGESYIRNYLAAFVPFSVGLGQMARAADPYQRDTRTMIDTIRNKIPGHLDSYFGNELPVRRDIWGEPLPSRTALGGAGVSAIYEQKVNSDPVNQAMWKVGVFPGSVQRKIRNVELTSDQYDDYARLAGRMAKMRLDKMVISPQFQQQIPSVQHDWMTEVIKQSRTSAQEMMMIKNPAIIHQAHDLKTAKRQAINDRNPDE